MKHPSDTQNGATLIISMIFLLILTVIGLAGMEVVSMEEKIAGNARSRNIAFQAAEAALLEGEALIKAGNLPAFDGSDGFFQPARTGAPVWLEVDWAGNEVRAYTGVGFQELEQSPAYIIEDYGPAPEGSLELNQPERARRFYRVTSRSAGLNRNTEVILQTIFKY
ncbi:pilus assembly PilX family protein [Neptuniibacter halophilus]|uniref:pilus assembly PilX family protein n=1 Tax=Neptuniibacter halophilus TaxID=651666 RepID=UPI0025730AA2|nr:PilX N-terminal domain-containing pilus assembly protein [Neptuniibacter halophilus]